jgi:type VI secretion system protein ImpA
MPPISNEALLAPVGDDDPCGPDLEFDQTFGALNRAAEGKPERQSGNVVIAAEEPDWREVEGHAEELLERTRDLRVLVHLAHARLHRGGLPGYAAVVSLTRELLATRWEGIHPRLDPEDDNDPIGRKNALGALAHPRIVLRYLRTLPLTSARTAHYSWRDIALATGRLQAEHDEAKPSVDAVRGAFADSNRAGVLALRAAADAAGGALVGINAAFDALAGAGSGPDYDDLGKLLHEIRDFVDQYGPAPDAPAVAAPEAEEPADGAADAPATMAPSRPVATMSIANITEVTSRADAVRLLGLIVQYFRRQEPSSPLPLLLDRALRLADKNFLEILRDLAPDGLMQAQNATGVRDE